MLGLLGPEDADRLSRLRHGAGSCVAVLVDSDTWAPVGARGRTSAEAYEASAALLVGMGWRVLRVEHGTTLASVWPMASLRGERTTA